MRQWFGQIRGGGVEVEKVREQRGVTAPLGTEPIRRRPVSSARSSWGGGGWGSGFKALAGIPPGEAEVPQRSKVKGGACQRREDGTVCEQGDMFLLVGGAKQEFKRVRGYGSGVGGLTAPEGVYTDSSRWQLYWSFMGSGGGGTGLPVSPYKATPLP